MCNCIDNINKVIREEYGDPEASLDVGFFFGSSILEVKPSGLGAHYRKKKKDGTFQERQSAVGITPTFCPFCGKNYRA